MTEAAAPIDARGKGLWTRWRTYLWRWLLFGAIAGLAQPVVQDFANFWPQKLSQALQGLPFGLLCFVAFTPLQNWVNTPRIRWKSWCTVLGTWMVMKFVFVGVMVALGESWPR